MPHDVQLLRVAVVGAHGRPGHEHEPSAGDEVDDGGLLGDLDRMADTELDLRCDEHLVDARGDGRRRDELGHEDAVEAGGVRGGRETRERAEIASARMLEQEPHRSGATSSATRASCSCSSACSTNSKTGRSARYSTPASRTSRSAAATSYGGPVAISATARSVCAATLSPAANPTASPSGNQEPASSV